MNALDTFCRHLVDKYSSPHWIAPKVMAEEWVAHSGLSALPCLSEIHDQLKRYGLSLKQTETPDLRAHHFCYGSGDPTIVYEEGEWRGAAEFTLLHELYEIILEHLDRIQRRHESPSRSEACWRANKFAAAVLMQKGIFMQALYESNFDIIWLHQHFYRAYSAVAIRAVELLNSLPPASRKELMCVVYDWSGTPEQWKAGQLHFRVGCAAYTSGLRVGSGGYPLSRMPQRGDGVRPGSIVEVALRTGRPVLLKRAYGFDSKGEKDLTCLARLVYWFNKPAKVIVEGMRLEDGYILETQASPFHHRVVAESYQVM